MSLALEVSDLTAGYGSTPVLRGVDLEVRPGETVALLGPSGSGKTTLLYSVAGFIEPGSGSIRIAGSLVHDVRRSVPPEDRSVGFVFQNYALWPHLSALETVAYPIRRAGASRSSSHEQALEILELVGIRELAERRPDQLSGGQQQRVGLARALARSAGLFLFDEPTAHLDAPVRRAIQDEIARRRRESGAAALYATHDSAEALAISDRVALIRDGVIVQEGLPSDVYEQPIDVWAGRLTGPAGLLLGAAMPGQPQVMCDGAAIPVGRVPETRDELVPVVIRPEWVRPGGPLRGEVTAMRYRGPATEYTVATAAGDLLAVIPGPPSLRIGESSGWTVERSWPVSGADEPV